MHKNCTQNTGASKNCSSEKGGDLKTAPQQLLLENQPFLAFYAIQMFMTQLTGNCTAMGPFLCKFVFLVASTRNTGAS